ncbi:MAG: hypothetical protein AAB505_01915, partial [Patescibacteria group bacterium]
MITSRPVLQATEPQKIELIKDYFLAAGTNREREKSAAKKLIELDPRLFLSVARTEDWQLGLAGVLEVTINDNFENSSETNTRYALKTATGQKFDFYPTDKLNLVSGTVVNLDRAQVLDNLIVADTSESNFHVDQLPQLNSLGDQKTAVLLVNFSDSPRAPFTKERAHEIIFNGQLQNFYREQSYDQTSFSGEVYGWYTVKRPANTGQDQPCSWPTLGQNGELDQFVANNFRPELYQRLVVLVNHPCFNYAQSTIGQTSITINGQDHYLSLAYIGGSSIWSNPRNPFNQNFSWTWLDYLLAHELGHSLGLQHANGWDCGHQSLGGNCQNIEYGNYFDTMGYGFRASHFNVFAKEYLGWIPDQEVLSISESGRYKVQPLEEGSVIDLPRFAKIK